MQTIKTLEVNCPEWYRIERETEKTIKKLYSVKELGYYLTNTDENIRRLAILRINELKLRDSIEMLRDIMEDASECISNRELAAWTLKAICVKWNIDLFITNRLLNKYTGTETYYDINKVVFNWPNPAIKFEFLSAFINSELGVGSDARNSDGVDFDTPFSFKEWFKTWLQEFLPVLKTILSRLPLLILHSFVITGRFIYSFLLLKSVLAVHSFLTKLSTNKRAKKEMRQKYGRQFNSSPFKRSFNPVHTARSIFFSVLYIMFYPLRLFIKHKLITLIAVTAVYCLLAFSAPGKVFTYRYFGFDLGDIHTETYAKSKEVLNYAWSEFKYIAGMPDRPRFITASETDSNENTEAYTSFKVVAKTGLNLRESPSANARKAQEDLLPNNAIVAYLGESRHDAEGKVWYMVRTQNGTTGWVYSKWLKETGVDDNG